MKKEIKETIVECAIAGLGLFATQLGQALTGMVANKRSDKLADQIKFMTVDSITTPLGGNLNHDITKAVNVYNCGDKATCSFELDK